MSKPLREYFIARKKSRHQIPFGVQQEAQTNLFGVANPRKQKYLFSDAVLEREDAAMATLALGKGEIAARRQQNQLTAFVRSLQQQTWLNSRCGKAFHLCDAILKNPHNYRTKRASADGMTPLDDLSPAAIEDRRRAMREALQKILMVARAVQQLVTSGTQPDNFNASAKLQAIAGLLVMVETHLGKEAAHAHHGLELQRWKDQMRQTLNEAVVTVSRTEQTLTAIEQGQYHTPPPSAWQNFSQAVAEDFIKPLLKWISPSYWHAWWHQNVTQAALMRHLQGEGLNWGSVALVLAGIPDLILYAIASVIEWVTTGVSVIFTHTRETLLGLGVSTTMLGVVCLVFLLGISNPIGWGVLALGLALSTVGITVYRKHVDADKQLAAWRREPAKSQVSDIYGTLATAKQLARLLAAFPEKFAGLPVLQYQADLDNIIEHLSSEHYDEHNYSQQFKQQVLNIWQDMRVADGFPDTRLPQEFSVVGNVGGPLRIRRTHQGNVTEVALEGPVPACGGELRVPYNQGQTQVEVLVRPVVDANGNVTGYVARCPQTMLLEVANLPLPQRPRMDIKVQDVRQNNRGRVVSVGTDSPSQSPSPSSDSPSSGGASSLQLSSNASPPLSPLPPLSSVSSQPLLTATNLLVPPTLPRSQSTILPRRLFTEVKSQEQKQTVSITLVEFVAEVEQNHEHLLAVFAAPDDPLTETTRRDAIVAMGEQLLVLYKEVQKLPQSIPPEIVAKAKEIEVISQAMHLLQKADGLQGLNTPGTFEQQYPQIIEFLRANKDSFGGWIKKAVDDPELLEGVVPPYADKAESLLRNLSALVRLLLREWSRLAWKNVQSFGKDPGKKFTAPVRQLRKRLGEVERRELHPEIHAPPAQGEDDEDTEDDEDDEDPAESKESQPAQYPAEDEYKLSKRVEVLRRFMASSEKGIFHQLQDRIAAKKRALIQANPVLQASFPQGVALEAAQYMEKPKPGGNKARQVVTLAAFETVMQVKVKQLSQSHERLMRANYGDNPQSEAERAADLATVERELASLQDLDRQLQSVDRELPKSEAKYGKVTLSEGREVSLLDWADVVVGGFQTLEKLENSRFSEKPMTELVFIIVETQEGVQKIAKYPGALLHADSQQIIGHIQNVYTQAGLACEIFSAVADPTLLPDNQQAVPPTPGQFAAQALNVAKSVRDKARDFLVKALVWLENREGLDEEIYAIYHATVSKLKSKIEKWQGERGMARIFTGKDIAKIWQAAKEDLKLFADALYAELKAVKDNTHLTASERSKKIDLLLHARREVLGLQKQLNAQMKDCPGLVSLDQLQDPEHAHFAGIFAEINQALKEIAQKKKAKELIPETEKQHCVDMLNRLEEILIKQPEEKLRRAQNRAAQDTVEHPFPNDAKRDEARAGIAHNCFVQQRDLLRNRENFAGLRDRVISVLDLDYRESYTVADRKEEKYAADTKRRSPKPVLKPKPDALAAAIAVPASAPASKPHITFQGNLPEEKGRVNDAKDPDDQFTFADQERVYIALAKAEWRNIQRKLGESAQPEPDQLAPDFCRSLVRLRVLEDKIFRQARAEPQQRKTLLRHLTTFRLQRELFEAILVVEERLTVEQLKELDQKPLKDSGQSYPPRDPSFQERRQQFYAAYFPERSEQSEEAMALECYRNIKQYCVDHLRLLGEFDRFSRKKQFLQRADIMQQLKRNQHFADRAWGALPDFCQTAAAFAHLKEPFLLECSREIEHYFAQHLTLLAEFDKVPKGHVFQERRGKILQQLTANENFAKAALSVLPKWYQTAPTFLRLQTTVKQISADIQQKSQLVQPDAPAAQTLLPSSGSGAVSVVAEGKEGGKKNYGELIPRLRKGSSASPTSTRVQGSSSSLSSFSHSESLDSSLSRSSSSASSSSSSSDLHPSAAAAPSRGDFHTVVPRAPSSSVNFYPNPDQRKDGKNGPPKSSRNDPVKPPSSANASNPLSGGS